ncbi:hypothetical protein [uncultured Capnocytophaga sp.]|uniref:hypothetical protein n=1 Tax=uncultured Capnocytophaga sp. TaxID=159273 RepID=UPI0025976719|nr:hypothetical protein [uncultured Capnocytophaga sp.]
MERNKYYFLFSNYTQENVLCRCVEVKQYPNGEVQYGVLLLDKKEKRWNNFEFEEIPISSVLPICNSFLEKNIGSERGLLLYQLQINGLICIDIIDIGVGVIKKSEWDFFDKLLEKKINSDSLTEKEESIFLSSSADVNDFFERLAEKSLKLSQESKDKIIAQIDVKKLWEKSEASDLLLMKEDPILCGYVRMNYETYINAR